LEQVLEQNAPEHAQTHPNVPIDITDCIGRVREWLFQVAAKF